MSNSNNSTSRGRVVYLPEHLLVLLILVGNMLLMHCSYELDERQEISIYQMAMNLLFFYVKCIIPFITDMILLNLTIRVAHWVSNKRQELLTLREDMCSPSCLLVESVCLIFLVFCVCCGFCVVCRRPVSCVPNISLVYSNAYLMFWSKYHSFNNLKFE